MQRLLADALGRGRLRGGDGGVCRGQGGDAHEALLGRAGGLGLLGRRAREEGGEGVVGLRDGGVVGGELRGGLGAALGGEGGLRERGGGGRGVGRGRGRRGRLPLETQDVCLVLLLDELVLALEVVELGQHGREL